MKKSSAVSTVVCPVCHQTTDIYRHVHTGYDTHTVFHLVLCQICASTLKVVTVVKGHFLEPNDLRATVITVNEPGASRTDRPRTPSDTR